MIPVLPCPTDYMFIYVNNRLLREWFYVYFWGERYCFWWYSKWSTQSGNDLEASISGNPFYPGAFLVLNPSSSSQKPPGRRDLVFFFTIFGILLSAIDECIGPWYVSCSAMITSLICGGDQKLLFQKIWTMFSHMKDGYIPTDISDLIIHLHVW